MSRRFVFRIIIVAAPLLAIAGVVLPLLIAKWQIDGLRRLTVTPTLESEPDNRASYYLASAAAVIAPPPALRAAANGLAKNAFDWASVRTVVQGFLQQNQSALDLMKSTQEMPNCRMPLLYAVEGDYPFRTADKLEAVGDLLFWSTLQHLHEGEYRAACEAALVNLRLGRDTALAGSADQSGTGLGIYSRATRSLGLALTQYALDPESLSLLQEDLPTCEFPEGFNRETLISNNEDWHGILHYDRSSGVPRLIRALHLEDHLHVSIRNFFRVAVFAGPWVGFSHPPVGEDLPNPLIEPGWDVLLPVNGLSSGLSVLRIGVAAVQYVYDNRVLPTSLKDLVPDYLAQLPENQTGTEFLCIAKENRLEIVSTGLTHGVLKRTLTFTLEMLTGGTREDMDVSADAEVE